MIWCAYVPDSGLRVFLQKSRGNPSLETWVTPIARYRSKKERKERQEFGEENERETESHKGRNQKRKTWG